MKHVTAVLYLALLECRIPDLGIELLVSYMCCGVHYMLGGPGYLVLNKTLSTTRTLFTLIILRLWIRTVDSLLFIILLFAILSFQVLFSRACNCQ
ncbi:hypothetical protein BJ165DRAFT_232841 [Panaeolus papilionaceus]|nr:hypothetical protein BJ165DRAFT_232841 [Panaeolus papilionaceus]